MCVSVTERELSFFNVCTWHITCSYEMAVSSQITSFQSNALLVLVMINSQSPLFIQLCVEIIILEQGICILLFSYLAHLN